MSGLSEWGIFMQDVLVGHEVGGVSQRAMERLCCELAAMTPPRFIRCHHDTKRGGLRVAMVGTADKAFRRATEAA